MRQVPLPSCCVSRTHQRLSRNPSRGIAPFCPLGSLVRSTRAPAKAIRLSLDPYCVRSRFMYTIRKMGLYLFAALILSGCAARRYQPVPIVPTEAASRLETQSLGDAGLHTFVEKNVGHPVTPWPPKTWNLATLSLAALYLNPSLESAKARVEEAQAAIVTAGARPNPSLSITPGLPSPYLFNLDFSVPIETAGKRGHRIQAARSLDQAAQFDLADSAWKVRSGVRLALLNYLLAS